MKRQSMTLLALGVVCMVLLLEAALLVLGNRSGVSSQPSLTPGKAASVSTRGSSNSTPMALKPTTVPSASVSQSHAEKSSWTLSDYLRILLGSGLSRNNKASMDVHQDRLQVWVSKGSGYYYCSGSAYYKMVHPGALMTQGRALQSGYQPRLGQPCG
jgi:hypothetical protein